MAVGSSFVLFMGMAQGQPGQSLDDIKKAWQQRQVSIKSLKVTWSEIRTQPKGYFDRLMPAQKQKEPNPPTDLRLPGHGVMTFDGKNCRFEIKRSMWSVTELKVKDGQEINVYKDGKDTALMTKSPITDHPSANVGRRKKPGDIMEYTYWPITCFARGLDPTFAPVDIDDFEFTGKSPIINGKKSVELAHRSRTNKSARFLLLDPERGFLLLRYLVIINDTVTLRLDVNYTPDPAMGWIPKSWDYAAITPKGGVRLESKQVKQEGWELNPALAADAFHLQLPPGTQVYDTTDGEAIQYAIRDDGESGPAIPDSSRPTYDQLTELAQQAQSERWWSSPITIVVVCLVSVLAAFALLWRRHRKASATGQLPVP